MAFMLSILLTLTGLSIIVFSILWMIVLIHNALRGTATLATSRRSMPFIIDLLKRTNANTTIIYDLGCGKGGVTCALKKAFPNAQVIGIDIDPIQLFFSRLRSFFSRRSVTFRRADLFTISLADATCVFAYLPLTMMSAIGEKLAQELKPGTLVVTNAKQFPQWSPITSAEKFFVYKKSNGV